MNVVVAVVVVVGVGGGLGRFSGVSGGVVWGKGGRVMLGSFCNYICSLREG